MDFFGIISWVTAQLANLLEWIIGAMNALIASIVSALSDLWNALVSLANWALSIFQKVGAFFANLWTNFLKPLWKRLVGLYTSIRARLQAIFGPVLSWIQRVRAWYYQYIYKWVVLVQQILSTIRVVLTAFRLLGAKWAAKLDADIQTIQGYITEFTSAIVSTLNAASTWLNIIADPAGIIRKDFFTGTLFSSLGAVKGAAAFGQSRAQTATEIDHQQGDGNLVKSPTGILTRNADGSVTLSDAAQRIADGANAAVDYYGRPGLIN